MELRAKYARQPPFFSHCCAFGHDLKGCNNRILSEEEKAKRMEAKTQIDTKSCKVQNVNDGWQDIPNRRTYKIAPGHVYPQPYQNNNSRFSYVTNGSYMSRGRSSIRGRGGTDNAKIDESTRWQGKMSPSTLIGGDPRKNDTMDMKEAQGNKAYTLEVHTKEAQRLLTHGCHAGNPCALHSNLTAKSTPIIERMYGQDWKERAET
ncbi:hypothetical protein Tco_0943837 [Tanacetum coccineum]